MWFRTVTLTFLLGLLRGVREFLREKTESGDSRGPKELADELRPESPNRVKFFDQVVHYAEDILNGTFITELDKMKSKMYDESLEGNLVSNDRLAFFLARLAEDEVSLFFKDLVTQSDLQQSEEVASYLGRV